MAGVWSSHAYCLIFPQHAYPRPIHKALQRFGKRGFETQLACSYRCFLPLLFFAGEASWVPSSFPCAWLCESPCCLNSDLRFTCQLHDHVIYSTLSGCCGLSLPAYLFEFQEMANVALLLLLLAMCTQEHRHNVFAFLCHVAAILKSLFELRSYGDSDLIIYCVHFRFGRFGDELLFGAQTCVLYVHFGSRPKWTCKVQHKGFVFLPGVSWWSCRVSP